MTINESNSKKIVMFVTRVCGQLSHDVMNELISRGYEVVGFDTQFFVDESAVTSAPYK